MLISRGGGNGQDSDGGLGHDWRVVAVIVALVVSRGDVDGGNSALEMEERNGSWNKDGAMSR